MRKPLLVCLAIATCALIRPARADEPTRVRDNLVALARLCGLVQHFHPSDQAAELDWPGFIRDAAPLVAEAGDPGALAAALELRFAPLAPSMQIFPSDAPPAPPAPLLASAETPFAGVIFWRHIGFTPHHRDSLFARDRMLIGLRNAEGLRNTPDPTSFPVYELGGGVSCRMPASLWVDTSGRTLPPPSADATSPVVAGGAALAPEFLDAFVPVVMVWNAVQHFSPAFRDAPPTLRPDWKAALGRAVDDALSVGDGGSLGPCNRMLAALNDAQAFIVEPSNDALPPMRLEWIDGSLLVAHCDPGAPVHVGDRVVEIDGAPAAEWAAHAVKTGPGARDDTRRRIALTLALLGPAGSAIELDVAERNGDAVRPVTVVRRTFPGVEQNPRELEPGVFYLDPAAYDDSTLIPVLQGALSGARAVIVDYRSLGARGLHRHLGSFLSGPAPGITRLVPAPRLPDQQDMAFKNSPALIVANTPHLPAKLIILVDSATRSDPELDVAFAKRMGFATIVGETTAGAAGPASFYDFTDDGRALMAMWTGTGTTLDGVLPLFGRGVEPHVAVSPTAAGLAQGRDEVLEAALKLASEE